MEPAWQQLRGLRWAWLGSMVLFVLVSIVIGLFALSSIERFLAQHQLQSEWVAAFVLPFILPNLIIGYRLRRFSCPACQGRFFGGGGSIFFRNTCAKCGATPKSTGDAK